MKEDGMHAQATEIRSLREQNEELMRALKATATRTDGDKEPCWCADKEGHAASRPGLFLDHKPYCLLAREAIAQAEARGGSRADGPLLRHTAKECVAWNCREEHRNA